LRTEWRAPHPGLWLDVLKPVLHRRNPAKIVHHVLLANGPDGDRLTVAVRNNRAKNRRAQEDALAVMPKRPVTEISDVRLLSSNQSWTAR
jgi:hypothetical protein